MFVLVNTAAEDDDLLDNADLLDSGTINFNGDDVLGLFKNDELIDVIGDINADRNDFAKDFTLRRKASVVFPNTTFEYNSDTASNLGEWDTYPTNTFSDIGNHSVTLSAEEYVFSSFKMFPNPASSSKVFFSIENEAKINIYNILGELVQIEKISKSNNSIYIGDLASGVYIIKGRIGNQFISKKLIKI